MKTSVVMATYNGEKYIKEQLDSLLMQTKKIDEIIICDDVSKDSTRKLIGCYIEEHKLESEWLFIQNEHNLGYADNFYKGLMKATGDYIFFADQDDIWCEKKVEKMTEIMEENQNIMMLCSDFEPLISSEDAPKLSKKVLREMRNDESIEQIPLNNKNIFIGSLGCVMCIRKEFRDIIKKYWFSGWAHDEYVWKLSQCMGGCYRYHKVLVKRRLHSNNVSMKKYHDLEKRIRFLSLLLESHKQTYKFAKEEKMSDSELKLIQKNIKSVEIRLDMLENRSLFAVCKSFFYWKYYHSVKSLLMEPYMAFLAEKRKNRENERENETIKKNNK